MKRLIALGLMVGAVLFLRPVLAADSKETSSKKALQALNDFIGDWKGSGGPLNKPRPDSKEIWNETVSWGWRFKGNDAWLVMAIKTGKHFKSGELHYVPEKKQYQLTAVAADGKKLVFDGDLKDEILTLSRIDPDKKETQRIKMNLAGDGVRFVYRFEHKPDGRTIFVQDYQVACTKEGESLSAKEKKIECVVSGGLGKIPVSFAGKTYYVCCSGCLDAFNENPAKFVKEYEAKKAGKK